jgi:hypothetical protein
MLARAPCTQRLRQLHGLCGCLDGLTAALRRGGGAWGRKGATRIAAELIHEAPIGDLGIHVLDDMADEDSIERIRKTLAGDVKDHQARFLAENVPK